MGVPGFFRELIKKYPDILKSDVDIKIKYLYIDANCLFHPQCFKILDLHKDSENHEKLESLMVDQIIKYIDYLIRMINPSYLVYIAVDGVAPLAKINQQRSRRFGYVDNYKHNIYRRYGIQYSNWSNIVITPGTQFMYNLHLRLKKYYKDKLSSNTDPKCTYKIIYSSYMTPGEGEHKILQHLKTQYKDGNTDAIIIYGLDADLIFLSMASQINNIFLLRESDVFNKNNDNELIFVDIDLAKKLINNEFNETLMTIDNNTDIVNFSNDYIFICYFLGNDFLPHLPSIDIHIGGMDMVVDAYLDTYEKFRRNLIRSEEGTVCIDNDFLIEFIGILSGQEDDFFRNQLPNHICRHLRKRCYETEPYMKDIWEIENLKNVKVNDTILLGVGKIDEWKNRYYYHYFKTYNNTQIIHNYMEGLLWVTKYYFEQCPTWKWQYQYSHAPFLSDIMSYMKHKNIMKDFQIKSDPPLNMYTQLVSIIPPTFSSILPKPLQHLTTSHKSPIIDMFPLKYMVDMINKTQLYKCIPIIPYLDVDRIDKIVKSIQLEKYDIDKSSLCKEFDLGTCAKVSRNISRKISQKISRKISRKI